MATTPQGETETIGQILYSLRVPIFLAIGLVVLIVLIALWIVYSRKREKEQIKATVQRYGMTPLHEESQIEKVSEAVADLFSDMSMYVRELRILSAYAAEMRGYSVRMAHAVLGLDRGNSTYTLDKVVVLVSGFDRDLPTFELMPSGRDLRLFIKNSIFRPGTPFGKANMVSGKDEDRIREAFNERVREQLADNRRVVMVSRGSLLAFYPHGSSVVPPDLAAFLEESVDLTDMLTTATEQ